MHQLFHLFYYSYIFEYFCYSKTFFKDLFSFAWFINWQTFLKKYGKSSSFGTMAIVSFVFSIPNSSNSFFVVSSSFSYFISFILSISSFSVTFSCLFVSRFSISFRFYILFGLTFLYKLKKTLNNNLHILWFKIVRLVYDTILMGCTAKQQTSSFPVDFKVMLWSSHSECAEFWLKIVRSYWWRNQDCQVMLFWGLSL